jgi:hypothetical protein
MVTGELKYNPYLIETEATFNGRSPKINSQIEKYLRMDFHEWVHKVPEIFTDELNGTDFTLAFSGTEADFKALQLAFLANGYSVTPLSETRYRQLKRLADKGNRLSSDGFRTFLADDPEGTPDLVAPDVMLAFQNELEDSLVKYAEVMSVLDWLKTSPNRRFNSATFFLNHADLFNEPFSGLTVGQRAAENTEVDDKTIIFRSVTSLQEIPEDITGMPVILSVTTDNLQLVEAVLKRLLGRPDFVQEQLFLSFQEPENRERVVREMQDLGLSQPQLIYSVSDENFRHYFREFSVTGFVRVALTLFDDQVVKIENGLDVDKKSQAFENVDLVNELAQTDGEIQKVKDAIYALEQRDNLQLNSALATNLFNFKEAISGWNKRKAKFMKENDAEEGAAQLTAYTNQILNAHATDIKQFFSAQKATIQEDLMGAYQLSGDLSFERSGTDWESPILPTVALPDFRDELLNTKTAGAAGIDEDVLDALLGIFGNKKDAAEQVTYLLEDWRKIAIEKVVPLSERLTAEVIQQLTNFEMAVADELLHSLANMLAKLTKTKESLSGELSEDMLLLQQDEDWLTTLKDQLFVIRRG